MTDLMPLGTVSGPRDLNREETNDRPHSLLEAIIAAAANPAVDVGKLESMLRMQERLEDRQREAQFNAAYARLQAVLPRVTKRGYIEYPANASKGTKAARIAYSKWEDVDAAIRSLLIAEGFSLIFDSPPGPDGRLLCVGTLIHVAGHSRSASIPLPLDTSGGKNNLQGAGSASSYGQRYTTKMLLNLVFEGEDDDGVEGGKTRISDAQLENLEALRQKANYPLDQFCEMWNVEALADLDVANFVPAMNGLSKLIARRKGGPE